MATSLGKVGIVDRGNYLQEETYNAGDFVLYNGSTWLALKDGILGVEPAEGRDWKYLARGFEAEVLSLITANDTSGLIGEAGQQVNAQSLIDVIADKVANRLIDKGLIVNNLVTDNTEMVLAAPMGKELKRQLDEQNNNITNLSSETYKRYGSVKSRLDMKNRGIYIMTDGDEKPNNDGAYLCISHGKQGVDWNYYVDVYALYGDSIPRYFFKVYSNDGINYFTGDYQKYITNSDLENYSLSRYTVTNQSELNNLLDGITNRYKPNSYYKFCVLIDFAGSTLGGGQWLIEGYLDDSTSRGVQKALRYNNGNVEYRMRSLDNLKWGSWISK